MNHQSYKSIAQAVITW